MDGIAKPVSEFLLSNRIPTASAADTVADAIGLMNERDTFCVFVVDDSGRLTGIFTEWDCVRRVLAKKQLPSAVTLASVMTAQPESLQQNDAIAYAINKMVVGGFRNVPVVDDEGKPLGLIDVRDVTGHLDQMVEERAGAVPATEDEWVDIGGG